MAFDQVPMYRETARDPTMLWYIVYVSSSRIIPTLSFEIINLNN